MTELEAKVDQYEGLLAEALEAASLPETPPADGTLEDGEACLEMARAYLTDGRHFRAEGEPVEALAAFSYGHGWLDAGARIGVLSVPTEGELFTV